MAGYFDGQTAIVTGGGSGIGRALGAELVLSGAYVVLADVDGESADAAAAALGRDHAEGHALDVADTDAVAALVDDVAARRDGLDLMFNNAGISMGGPSHELTAAHWERIMAVNVRGVVNGVLAAYPRLRTQGHGHIVNTASGAGLVPPPLVLAYATTKHAVVGLSVGLRPEAALHGVRVSVLCPGAVETPILDRLPAADLPVTASASVSPRQYLAKVRQRPIPAERFARLALRDVARNKSIIVVPRSAATLWYLNRLSPALVGRISRSIARTVERDLVRPRS
jgi:NAD(P)-dependent dehydrogenase (short-subunit alcohol dehydrogenase family)